MSVTSFKLLASPSPTRSAISRRPHSRRSSQNHGILDTLSNFFSSGKKAEILNQSSLSNLIDTAFLGFSVSFRSLAWPLISTVSVSTDRVVDQLRLPPAHSRAIKIGSDLVLAAAVPSLGLPYLGLRLMSGPIQRLSAEMATQLPASWPVTRILSYKTFQYLGSMGAAYTIDKSLSLLSDASDGTSAKPADSGESSRDKINENHAANGVLDSDNVGSLPSLEGPVRFSDDSTEAQLFIHEIANFDSLPDSEQVENAYQALFSSPSYKEGDVIAIPGCPIESLNLNRYSKMPPFFVECDSESGVSPSNDVVGALKYTADLLETVPKVLDLFVSGAGSVNLKNACDYYLKIYDARQSYINRRVETISTRLNGLLPKSSYRLHLMTNPELVSPDLKPDSFYRLSFADQVQQDVMTMYMKGLVPTCERVVGLGENR